MGKLLGVALAITLSAACADFETGTDVAEVKTSAEVLDFSTGVDVGDSNVDRDDDNIEFEIEASLVPGHVYTVWFCGFDNPAACTNGIPGLSQCGPGDLAAFGGDPATESFCEWSGTGDIATEDGEVEFENKLAIGDHPGEVLFGNWSNIDAEFLFVIRSHEGPVDGALEDQLTTFNGGCPPNTCADVAFTFL